MSSSSPFRASARTRAKKPRLASRGGLIVIGGPAYGGKNVLAARLAEWLPRVIKLETVDRLPDEVWFPNGLEGRAVARPERPMLAHARTLLAKRGIPPTVILVARFGEPSLRERAVEAASAAEVPFLYVEARSSNIRALRRLFRIVGSHEDAAERMKLYERATEKYVQVDSDETRTLPCVRLAGVLRDVDAASARVLAAWGAV
jgi:predicted kinase